MTPKELYDELKRHSTGLRATKSLADESDKLTKLGSFMFDNHGTLLRALSALSALEGARRGLYVASRVKHAPMWQRERELGAPIISTWIDEAGEGETASMSELWERITREVLSALTPSLSSALSRLKEAGL